VILLGVFLCVGPFLEPDGNPVIDLVWVSMMGAVFSLVGGILLFFSYRQRIWWTDDTLMYRKSWKITKIKFCDIGEFDTRMISYNRGSQDVLHIESKQSTMPAMVIVLMPFSLPDLKRLGAKLTEATGSEKELAIHSYFLGRKIATLP
jgi:hypothetical protein